jgi:pentose-5-phosphate-3-epimerase
LRAGFKVINFRCLNHVDLGDQNFVENFAERKVVMVSINRLN